jgi:hypothetical protein
MAGSSFPFSVFNFKCQHVISIKLMGIFECDRKATKFNKTLMLIWPELGTGFLVPFLEVA